jgi:hypothetical protein
MRVLLSIAVVAVFVTTTPSALAQSADDSGEGGLHVCCGGSVGYIGGGSGTISGHVRGPSGSGSHEAVKPSVADTPSALDGGAVKTLRLPALSERDLHAERAASTWPRVFPYAALLLLAAAVFVVYRRLPAAEAR